MLRPVPVTRREKSILRVEGVNKGPVTPGLQFGLKGLNLLG